MVNVPLERFQTLLRALIRNVWHAYSSSNEPVSVRFESRLRELSFNGLSAAWFDFDNGLYSPIRYTMPPLIRELYRNRVCHQSLPAIYTSNHYSNRSIFCIVILHEYYR